jgi:hypothetical protein
MRKATLIINVIVVAFFTSFLAYTFLARGHLESLARAFVTEKTIVYSKPIVALAEAALESPLIQKALSEDQIGAIRGEIADYWNDPTSYITDLTRQKIRKIPVTPENPLIEKVASFKNKTRTFFDNTLTALITDLRIFSLSNAVAGLIAFGLAYRSSTEIRKGIVWFSFLMFVGVLYCSFLYVDDLTFFRILFRSHMGIQSSWAR